jgi:hypothetical protein
MTLPELTRLRDAVIGAIRGITPDGARERVRAMAEMPAPISYFTPALLPLAEVPTLVLFAEREEDVLDPGSPTRFALETALPAYFPRGRVHQVTAAAGSAPVQHASLIFHVFEFLPYLGGFYAKLRQARLKSAA